MKLSLQLKLGQQLTMTPQLQQAIRLLQLSTLDLQQEIHQALESNPMLELIENADEEENTSSNSSSDSEISTNENPPKDSADSQNSDIANGEDSNWQEEIPRDLAVDSNWDDIYPNSPAGNQNYDSEQFDFESRNSAEETLQDHLMWQLNLTPMSESDESIAMAIIDAIDANGMLTVDLESLHSGFDPEMEIEIDEIVAVLHRIQQFDPIGVAYRSLSECLLIQLNQMVHPERPKLIENAKLIIGDHIDLLGHRDYAQLMRKTKIKEAELGETIALIETLDPRPGSNIAPPSTTYIVPDVFVSKDIESGKWKVELNPETAPKIRINNGYASLVKRADTSDDNSYLRDNLQEARWFIKSLQQRNDTLLRVAKKIVERQTDFLEHGPSAMKPLVLHDISKEVDLHESTVSRVTTQKYMLTPKGVFELKYFFSSHVTNNLGGDVSSTAIKEVIKQLVADENPQKPLSDSKLCSLLAQKNITVARRTIAKYRDILQIPPSNERKQLI